MQEDSTDKQIYKKLQKTPKAEKELDLILCYRSAKFCGIATFV